MNSEIPRLLSFEEKLAQNLGGIDIARNDALDQVAEAILKKHDWEEKRGEYVTLIDHIRGNFEQIHASPSMEEKIPLHREMLDYVGQLPETSGLRKKVMDIISIPDLEDTSSTSPFAS
ncbi:MAG: hypothetical protein KA034_00710 [Candidatus Moranbacteria bacterium]|nr:hypothetical protein [Candidatus Moranbacteria bacterium]